MSVQSHKKQCHQLWIVKDDKHCHQKTRRITNPEAIREAECSALPLLNSGFQIHGYGLFCWIMGLHIYLQIILRVPTPVLPMTTPFPSPNPLIFTLTLANSGLSKKPTAFTFPKISAGVNTYLPWREEVLPRSLLLNPQNHAKRPRRLLMPLPHFAIDIHWELPGFSPLAPQCSPTWAAYSHNAIPVTNFNTFT